METMKDIAQILRLAEHLGPFGAIRVSQIEE